jgi:2-haloacid dehalogenase
MDIDGITHLSFDCYGTLVDWETGILVEASTTLTRAGIDPIDPSALLRSYAKHEADIEAGPYRPYRAVLAETMRRMGTDVGAALDADACAAFADALGRWPLFPDTPAALERLAQRYRLVVLSNVDDDLFAATARALPVRFDAVITAHQVRSYKPAPAHFHTARDRLGLHPGNWLHVAQSLYHDHVPAKALGLRSVWVDRPTRLHGTGLAPDARATYDARTTNLADVADLLRA